MDLCLHNRKSQRPNNLRYHCYVEQRLIHYIHAHGGISEGD